MAGKGWWAGGDHNPMAQVPLPHFYPIPLRIFGALLVRLKMDQRKGSLLIKETRPDLLFMMMMLRGRRRGREQAGGT